MHNTNRRSRLDIYLEILEMVADGVDKPTNIMYKVNTSWLILSDALTFLESKGFIQRTQVRTKNLYSITQKGMSTLMYFRKVKEDLLEEVREEPPKITF
jgi:predicted transcriptional regulator